MSLTPAMISRLAKRGLIPEGILCLITFFQSNSKSSLIVFLPTDSEAKLITDKVVIHST